MITLDWLNQVRELNRTMRTMQSRCKSLENNGGAEVDLQTVRQELKSMSEQMRAAYTEIDAALKGTEPKLRMVLEARYLSCMKWQAIAESMGYSLNYVQRLHVIAMNKIGVSGAKMWGSMSADRNHGATKKRNARDAAHVL